MRFFSDEDKGWSSENKGAKFNIICETISIHEKPVNQEIVIDVETTFNQELMENFSQASKDLSKALASNMLSYNESPPVQDITPKRQEQNTAWSLRQRNSLSSLPNEVRISAWTFLQPIEIDKSIRRLSREFNEEGLSNDLWDEFLKEAAKAKEKSGQHSSRVRFIRHPQWRIAKYVEIDHHGRRWLAQFMSYKITSLFSNEVDALQRHYLGEKLALLKENLNILKEIDNLTMSQLQNLRDTSELIKAQILDVRDVQDVSLYTREFCIKPKQCSQLLKHGVLKPELLTLLPCEFCERLEIIAPLIINKWLRLSDVSQLTKEQCLTLQSVSSVIIANKISLEAAMEMHFDLFECKKLSDLSPLICEEHLTFKETTDLTDNEYAVIKALMPRIRNKKLSIDEVKKLQMTPYQSWCIGELLLFLPEPCSASELEDLSRNLGRFTAEQICMLKDIGLLVEKELIKLEDIFDLTTVNCKNLKIAEPFLIKGFLSKDDVLELSSSQKINLEMLSLLLKENIEITIDDVKLAMLDPEQVQEGLLSHCSAISLA